MHHPSAIRHYWNAPKEIHTVPRGTTVVVTSNCGRKMNLPAWKVIEWASQPGSATKPAVDTACAECAGVDTALPLQSN